ncbi:hypothetical protein L7F22_014413 [Adiantum nelumboides]|nr:hypothetical protein [Adiantum nelumboides]
MPIERAFKMLKSRFCILLKRCDTDLRHVPDVVAACLVLHNMCLVHGDSFLTDWVRKAEQDLQDSSSVLASQLSQARSSDLESQLRAIRLALNEVQAVLYEDTNDIVQRGQSGEAINGHESRGARGSGTERCNNLARSMYCEFLRPHGHGMFLEENNEQEEDINEMVF